MGRAFEYRKASKMKRWGQMSKIFPRLGKAITLAAKEGGPDPDMNAKLRHAIQTAKGQNMPKDNIDAAIKRASGKDADSVVEVNYEGKGPHGILVFIECASDNTTRTIANVKSYFNKAGGSFVPTGSLQFMFDRKAVFEFDKTEEMDIEELELELIDAGLEKIELDEGTVSVQADYHEYGTLSEALENLEIDVKNSSLQRFPTSPVDFTDEQMVDIEKFLDKLGEDEDVLETYTNMA